ncbi:MAG: acyl-ACP--UDP-N-acetylglucosamine O-acyltransferase [Akkermansiaceae bacterium]|nr:acyl-ACP--UDP-N-acetylglucosamine O-acyltransferase [Verrucomicrobiales bacterium]
MIHPTAIIHPKARLDSTVEVGPYAIIDESVEIGPQCVIGPHVFITGVTKIGSGNRFHVGCAIGDAPQDFKYQGEPTRLRIGNNNVFREHFIVHRATKPEEETVIGSNNFLMGNAHVGHNCVIGDHVVMGNGTMLAGHVVVEDRVFFSGSCLMHQFVRIGTLALMQGGARISKDLPPFTVAHRGNEICGLNTIGLRRAGLTSEERLELKRLYHALFRSDQNLRAAVAKADAEFTGKPARKLLEFVAQSKRGVCCDSGRASVED